MTQYVRIIRRTSKIDRPVGTILKVIENKHSHCIVVENDMKYACVYYYTDIELIPEEIVNSSLFKIMNEID